MEQDCAYWNYSGRKMLYSNAQSKKYPEFGERMREKTAEGDDLWWYVCWEPGLPYLNMYVDMTGLQNRLLFWQQKMYGVNGFLYWSSMYWPKVEDPWENIATVGTDYKTGKKWLSDEVFGDGSLMYPGTKVGVDGPCGSFRLEMIRDGLEEFCMFTMLEELKGREKVDEIINRVTSSVIRFTDSDEEFAAARLALGDALAMTLLHLSGFRREDFAKLHPGGAIGRTLLVRVRDIMRTGERLAAIAPDAPVSEAIVAMTRAHGGAAFAVDPEGRLLGIFTDGDFRRAVASGDAAVLAEPVGRLMTRGPVTVGPDALAVDVLHLLEHRAIDDLPVVDEHGRLAGAIDIQDLPKFKLL